MSELLKKALEDHGGDDIVISYEELARCFPTDQPHPDSFEYNYIDEKALQVWAKTNGWKIEKLIDKAKTTHSPAIRFTKIEI